MQCQALNNHGTQCKCRRSVKRRENANGMVLCGIHAHMVRNSEQWWGGRYCYGIHVPGVRFRIDEDDLAWDAWVNAMQGWPN